MPTMTGQNMRGQLPTLAELGVMANNIENMVHFDNDGELVIDDLNMYALAVHELCDTITI